jgi:hypothetical protein
MIYEVEVLLDDGSVVCFQVMAASPDAAEIVAMQDAKEWMQRPVEANTLATDAA